MAKSSRSADSQVYLESSDQGKRSLSRDKITWISDVYVCEVEVYNPERKSWSSCAPMYFFLCSVIIFFQGTVSNVCTSLSTDLKICEVSEAWLQQCIRIGRYAFEVQARPAREFRSGRSLVGWMISLLSAVKRPARL